MLSVFSVMLVLIFLSFFLNWSFFMMVFLGLSPLMFLLSVNSSFLSKNDYVCLDLNSFLMVVLSLWIVFLSLISSYSFFKYMNFYLFILSSNLLLLFLVMSFTFSSLLMFFFSFESTLLPTILIIVGWGYKVERLSSGMYMFFYTLFGSLPLLVGIFLINLENFSLVMNLYESNGGNGLLYFICVIGFLVKMPMFFVHSWLPKAHVEAPVAGSMILAGILLKLGGYGLYRFMTLYKAFISFNSLWVYISVWGGISASLISIRQYDMKSLIAYSSVSHMSLVIISIMLSFCLSPFSSFLMMVAHGFSSSALFFLVNLVYERSQSRSLFLNKGIMSVFPILSMWWFIFCAFNMAGPPSLNLISEIFIINIFVSWSFSMVFFMMVLSFLSAVYSLFLFSSLNHGTVFSSLNFLNACVAREYFILILHLLPLMFLFLKLDLFF